MKACNDSNVGVSMKPYYLKDRFTQDRSCATAIDISVIKNKRIPNALCNWIEHSDCT